MEWCYRLTQAFGDVPAVPLDVLPAHEWQAFDWATRASGLTYLKPYVKDLILLPELERTLSFCHGMAGWHSVSADAFDEQILRNQALTYRDGTSLATIAVKAALRDGTFAATQCCQAAVFSILRSIENAGRHPAWIATTPVLAERSLRGEAGVVRESLRRGFLQGVVIRIARPHQDRCDHVMPLMRAALRDGAYHALGDRLEELDAEPAAVRWLHDLSQLSEATA